MKPVIWCASGTQTYVTITITSPFPDGRQLDSALSDIDIDIRYRLFHSGDEVIGRGLHYRIGAVDMKTWDAISHRTTWGVLGAACTALLDFINYFSINGGLNFDIYDGRNQVGSGKVTWIVSG